MIRFIHLSDVHLGAVPDRGCPWSHEREEEIWETFRRVIVGTVSYTHLTLPTICSV